ncbi:MAG: beta-lactamase family protein [Planctomycetes bacterium]|nr:beta-lactamase family protein [Planctomycetota bacterium]
MHPIRPLLLATLALSPVPATAQGQLPLVTDFHDFTAIDAEMQRVVATAAPAGACLSIARQGTLLFERCYGGYAVDTQVPIASATKWLSGAVIMALVDDGLLDLDAPVATWLPEFTGLKGTLTTRQMFSHTSGLPGSDPVISDDNITLAQAVSYIAANVPLRVPPGTDFFYGGVSMHVAGRVAEVVSGTEWGALFAARIAGPLGMMRTDYLGIGSASNPRIAGGARSTLRDYARFMEMIEGRGTFRGRRILSERAIDTMLQDQTGGVPVTSAPPTVPDPFPGYGIGCWMERVDGNGRTLEATSPGAFGFTGFVDRERGTAGVFLVRSLNQRTDPFADRVRELTREQLRFAGVDSYGGSAPACAGPLRARTTTAPLAGEPAFALTCENAPPLGFGVCLVSPSAAIPPLPVLGVDVHVALGPVTIGETVVADLRRAAVLSVPLTAVPPATLAFAQFAFLPTRGCTAPTALATSHALSIRVR